MPAASNFHYLFLDTLRLTQFNSRILKTMKKLRNFFLIACGMAAFSLSAEITAPQAITPKEAAAIVKAQEEAKENALDKREAELLNARITGTAVANLGHKKIILNRVQPEKPVSTKAPRTIEKEADFNEAAFFDSNDKEHLSFTLSGTVREGISELWWKHGEHDFKIFTNANFLYFQGIGDSFENEDAVYSVFPIIIQGSATHGYQVEAEEWRPTWDDFNNGGLEYYVVQSSGIEEIDARALEPITLMLEYYQKNSGQMKVSYENAQKLREARQAYLETNPPKERDVIINSAPIDKSTRR